MSTTTSQRNSGQGLLPRIGLQAISVVVSSWLPRDIEYFTTNDDVCNSLKTNSASAAVSRIELPVLPLKQNRSVYK